jgi:hypothetical protein
MMYFHNTRMHEAPPPWIDQLAIFGDFRPILDTNHAQEDPTWQI